MSRIRFLGTGTSQGIPVIGCDCAVCLSQDKRNRRTRTSAIIDTGERKIIIDTGPDFREQLLSAKISDLDAILYTHAHRDHTGGIDDVRPINFRHNKEIPAYGEAHTLEDIIQANQYIFMDTGYKGKPQISLHYITPDEPFELFGKTIVPVSVIHGNAPVTGFRFGNLAYITDASAILPAELDKLKNLDILVLNALQRIKHFTHFNLAEALEIIASLKPRQAYLLHISHNMGLFEQVQAELPTGVNLAYDGLEVEFDWD